MDPSTDDELFILNNPGDALVREVFARFGRAFYAANCLEREIAGTLMHVEWRSNLRPPMTREEFHESYDTFYGTLAAMPMGRLVARLKALSDLPPSLHDALDACLSARNSLAHHYFWERSGTFALASGQRQMIDECDSFLQLFENTDAEVHAYVTPHLQRHGVTHEAVANERGRIIQDARDRLA